MPVTAIPFKAPAAFDIPPHMADAIRHAPRQAAAMEAIALLEQIDAGEALAIGFTDADGRLGKGPHAATDPAAFAALQALGEARDAAPAGPDDFMGRAVADAKPLLYMGEVGPDEAGFPAAFRDWLLGGQAAAPVGFLYVYPLLAPDGKAHGALMIRRSLAAGPLNHDQPAIANALAGLLGEAAARG